MFFDYISAATLIFLAEMGDKTQFLAMAFATKYKTHKILLGVALGSFLNHGLAMILGRGLVRAIPGEMISFAAGLMFIFFAFQSLKVEDEAVEESQSKFGPVFTVALAFFIGELGDKTQLAALGLAVDSNHVLFSLMGTVTGMVLTSAMAIFIGLKLGRNIPEDKLKLAAFSIFIVFGVQKLYGSYLGDLNGVLVLGLAGLLGVGVVLAYLRFKKAYAAQLESGFKLQAEALKRTREVVELKVLNLCKGQDTCGVCDEDRCLVGHMKALLKNSDHPIEEKEVEDLKKLKNKAFDSKEADDILQALLAYYERFPKEFEDNLTFKEIRKAAECILQGYSFTCKTFDQYKKEALK